MDAPDKRMCASVDYYDEVYDDDCFGDIFNGLDLPADNLDGDGLTEDWASKLGPIPAEVFREILPDSGCGGGGLLSGCCFPNVETSQPKRTPILNRKMFRSPTFFEDKKTNPLPRSSEDKKTNPLPRSFEAPSPDSVLERGTSGPTHKPISFGIEIPIPIRIRTKRSRPRSTVNPWSTSPFLFPPIKQKKRRRHLSEQEQPINSSEIKKCTHCEITKTPQWREGPMGPKTLCNACGVRYRSGRLFPEYRPAASPTFIPSVHSNSHRKVIEMRQKGAAMDDNCVLIKKEHLGLNQTRNCSSE